MRDAELYCDKEIYSLQVRLLKPCLLRLVLDVLLQHRHYLIVVLFRNRFQISGPVIDVPVVGHVVYQVVVLGDLFGGHGGKVLGHEGAEQQVVLQHSAFPRLIDESRLLRFQRLVLLVLVLGQGQVDLVVTVDAGNGVGIGRLSRIM